MCVVIVPIEVHVVPPLQVIEAELGGIYANDAPLLCGDRLCGGPLDFPAASSAGSRPSNAFPIAGAFVDM